MQRMGSFVQSGLRWDSAVWHHKVKAARLYGTEAEVVQHSIHADMQVPVHLLRPSNKV